jgi:hypothetical protein
LFFSVGLGERDIESWAFYRHAVAALLEKVIDFVGDEVAGLRSDFSGLKELNLVGDFLYASLNPAMSRF